MTSSTGLIVIRVFLLSAARAIITIVYMYIHTVQHGNKDIANKRGCNVMLECLAQRRGHRGSKLTPL